MVDNKLGTGSIRKKHLADSRKEKAQKILEKSKSADGGSPAKKVKPADAANAAVSAEDKKKKKMQRHAKRKALKEKAIVNVKRTDEKEAEMIKQATEYLANWKNKKESWKFSKNLQTWLIANMLSVDKVDSEDFAILLEYLNAGRGSMRDNVTKVAMIKARAVRAQTEPNEEQAAENQEILSRCERMITTMSSKVKKIRTPKSEKALIVKETAPAAAKENNDETEQKKKRKRHGKRGKADKLGLRKAENGQTAAAVSESKEEEGSQDEKPAKKVKKEAKVVSFMEEEEKAPVKAKATKKKAAAGKVKKAK